MDEPVYIKIESETLRRNMEQARGYEVTRNEFERTLRDAGFTRLGASWYCDRARLNALDESEVQQRV